MYTLVKVLRAFRHTSAPLTRGEKCCPGISPGCCAFFWNDATVASLVLLGFHQQRMCTVSHPFPPRQVTFAVSFRSGVIRFRFSRCQECYPRRTWNLPCRFPARQGDFATRFLIRLRCFRISLRSDLHLTGRGLYHAHFRPVKLASKRVCERLPLRKCWPPLSGPREYYGAPVTMSRKCFK